MSSNTTFNPTASCIFSQNTAADDKQIITENNCNNSSSISKSQQKKMKNKQQIINQFAKEEVDKMIKEKKLLTNDPLENKIRILSNSLNDFESQEPFQTSFDAVLFAISGLIGTVQNDNSDYRNSKNNFENEIIKNSFLTKQETNLKRAQAIDAAIEKYNNLANERIKVLKNEETCRTLEQALIQEGLIGYDSAIGGIRYDRFGVPHRLTQIQNALTQLEKASINPNPVTSVIESSFEIDIYQIKAYQSQLKDLTIDLDNIANKLAVLKEENLIFNAALVTVKGSSLPQLFYGQHKKKYEQTLKNIEKAEIRKIDWIKNINERYICETDPKLLKEMEEEKKDILKKWDKIESRLNEVKKILETRLTTFKLSDGVNPDLSTDILKEKFNNELVKKIDLLMKKIINLKEDLIRTNSLAEPLNVEDKELKLKKFRSRLKKINWNKADIEGAKSDENMKLKGKIGTYQTWIIQLEKIVSKIILQKNSLDQEIKKCKEWKLTQVPSDNLTSSSSWFGGWFSSQPTAPSTVPVQNENKEISDSKITITEIKNTDEKKSEKQEKVG